MTGRGQRAKMKTEKIRPMQADDTGKAHMRSLHGRLLLPAMLAVGLVLSGAPAAFAGDFSVHGGFGHPGFRHGGHNWHGHAGNWHGPRPLRPLPSLVRPRSHGGGMAMAGRRPHLRYRSPVYSYATYYNNYSYNGYAYGGDLYGGNGLPSWVPGIGTFAGDISAVADFGNGVYISTGGPFFGERQVAPPPPDAKIIVVKPDMKNGGCSIENGVCVIRP